MHNPYLPVSVELSAFLLFPLQNVLIIYYWKLNQQESKNFNVNIHIC